MSISTASYLVWGALGVVALALWLLSYVRPGAVAPPSEVVARATSHPVLRMALLVGVMWVGWHLFAR